MERKTYKFSSSIFQGGFLYCHRIANGKIKDKNKLRTALDLIVKKFKLIDATIKVYDTIFFLFFVPTPKIVPIELIACIQESIESLGEWDEKYLYEGMYDIQEEYVRKYLDKLGFNYDEGQ